jgi:hypothetical protein
MTTMRLTKPGPRSWLHMPKPPLPAASSQPTTATAETRLADAPKCLSCRGFLGLLKVRRSSESTPSMTAAAISICADLANWPLTVIAFHIVLFLNTNVGRSGASVHRPTASLKSSETEDISSSLGKLIDNAREDLRQCRRGWHDA